MKKVLSMVLALALVLTTLVVPMTVSAAGETFTISYKLTNGAAEVTNIYPGDTITVDVYAAASAEAEAIYELYIPTPADMGTITPGAGATLSGSFVKVAVDENGKKTFTAEPQKVTSYSFTVPAGATGEHSIPAIEAGTTDSYFTLMSTYEDITASAAAHPFVVTPHSATVLVKVGAEGVYAATNEILSASATDVYVKVESDTTEISDLKVAKQEAGVYGEATSFTNYGIAFSNYGTYKITYKTVDDAKDHEYVITYKSNVVADLVLSAEKTAVPGGTFTVNVSVDQLAGNLVEVLTFDVVDSDKLTLDTTNTAEGKVTYEGNTVTFRAPQDGGIAQGATVVALKFNVAEKYVGTESVQVTNQKLAVNAGFDASASNLDQNSADIVKVTVSSSDAVTAAELGAEIDFATSRNIPVQQTAGWTVKEGQLAVAYASYSDQQTSTAAADMFNETNIIPLTGNVNVTESKYYYVIARYGEAGHYVYEKIAEYDKDALKIDRIAPIVNMNTTFENWTNAATVVFSVTDAGAGVETMSYKLSAEAPEWSTSPVAGGVATVTLPGNVVITSIIVKAADILTNESDEKIFDIKYDAVAPVIVLGPGVYTNGVVPIEITVTAADNDVPENAEIKHYAENPEDATVKEAAFALVSGVATYNAATKGYYIVSVTDRAGNVATVTSEFIETDKQSVLMAPTFDVLSGEAASTGSLKTDAQLDELYGAEVAATNGTFTYMNVTANAAATTKDYKTEYTLNGAEWTPGEITDANDYTLVVKTYMIAAPTDYQEATYTFSITDRANFKTVNGDTKYRLSDYLILGIMTKDGADFARDAAAKFTGGYFSGNVTGDLMNDWAADRTEMLNKIKGAGNWRNYDFAIYNGLDAIQ